MEAVQRFRVWYASQPTGLRTLVAINAAAYLLWNLVLIWIEPVQVFVWLHLALNPGLPGILFEPWQLLTYAFLHLQPGFGGLLHVGFNMLWLWWLGRDLEELQGSHTLVAVYAYGALGGAILTVMLHGAFPGSPIFNGIVHGASGAVLGVMTALAVLYPFKSIGLFLIGTVRLRHVVIGLLLLDILFLSSGGTSVSAHFGGAMAGLAFARLQQMGTDTTGWARVFFQSGGRSRRPGGASKMDRAEAWLSRRRTRKGSGEITARVIRMDPRTGTTASRVAETRTEEAPDVDRILDKISEKGYDSLTPAEKKVLYEASGE
jgi:rhomboid family protein